MTTMTTDIPATVELRSLDEAAFRERYSCDRLTASILVSRFRYVNAHMSTKLVSNAFSIVIREMADFCTTIQGPPELGWAMPAASLTNPVHWGPVTDAVGIVLEEVGLATLRPGDVVIANDSYRTGKHLNDVSFIRPLFHEGALVGAVHITAHQLDVGSRVPGGFDLLSQSLWEDGLVLTPMLLYSEGRPVHSTFNLIAANTRWPDVILADLQVICSSLDLGEQLLLESIDRYGIDAYLGAIRYACDVGSEEMHRALEEALADGSYEGVHVMPDASGDDDSPNMVRVRVNKHGNRLEFDFSGTSAQTSSSVNCSWLDAKTGVTIALKMLFDRTSVASSGTLRNVDFVLPPGSMVNAKPPAATMYYCTLVDAVMKATIDALNPALGIDAIAFDTPIGGGGHRATGRTSDGAKWEVTTAEGNIANFPKGATRSGDADSYGLLAWMNMPALSTEVVELANPLLILEAEAVPDSSGAGYNRGGAGMSTTIQYVHGGTHYDSAARPDCRAPGAFGGSSGAPPSNHILQPTAGDPKLGSLPTPAAAWRDLPADGVMECGPGATFRRVMAAGGGWGNPLDREPQRVKQDVRDGYLTIHGAATHYGVVVIGDPQRDPEHLTVHEEATAELRRREHPALTKRSARELP
jgi:N-methylhydantoinase B